MLVRVTPPDPGAAKHLRVEVDGVDVTSSFHGQAGRLVARARRRDERRTARRSSRGRTGTGTAHLGAGRPRLKVVNHPITGRCSRARSSSRSSARRRVRPRPGDRAACSAPTQVTYRTARRPARSPPLADPTVRPADLARRRRWTAGPCDYIVRLERGTIDRAVYEIAALYDRRSRRARSPRSRAGTSGSSTRSAAAATSATTRAPATGGVLNDLFLSQGYAVASSSLNVLDNNCSPVISAEAAMMVKEHFIETLRPGAALHDRLGRLRRRDPAAR